MGKIVVVVMTRVVFGIRIAAIATTGKARPKALIRLEI